MPGTKPLLLFCSVLGVAMVLAGLLADTLSLGNGRGFGHIQLLLTVAGGTLTLLTAGSRTRPEARFAHVSTVFLNTLLLLAFLELTATACLRFMDREGTPAVTNSDGYDEGLYPGWTYMPAVTFRSVPNVASGLVTTDSVGFRVTPGNEPDAQQRGFVVSCFGGSTMWGWGEKDENTIPALLQQILSSELDCPVTVLNRSSPGWVSTQELLQLLFCLWEGERPDLVIFYDGGNDFGLTRMGMAGGHLRREYVESSLTFDPCRGTQGLNLLAEGLGRSNIFKLLSTAIGRYGDVGFSCYPDIARDMGHRPSDDSLGAVTLSAVTGNYRVALALGEFYGFSCLFVWHPVLAASSKTPTVEEMPIHDDMTVDSLFNNGVRSTWEMAEAMAEDRSFPGFVYLGGALDSCTLQCFIDDVHLNLLGNRIMAESIFNVAKTLDLIAPPPSDGSGCD